MVNQSISNAPNLLTQQKAKLWCSVSCQRMDYPSRTHAVLCSDSFSAQLHEVINSFNILSALKSAQRASPQACIRTLKQLRIAHCALKPRTLQAPQNPSLIFERKHHTQPRRAPCNSKNFADETTTKPAMTTAQKPPAFNYHSRLSIGTRGNGVLA